MRHFPPFPTFGLLLAAPALLAACADAPESPAVPDAPDATPAPVAAAPEAGAGDAPPPADATLPAAVAHIAREAIAASIPVDAPGDAIGVNDDTPRLDAEREPPEGFVWAFLHSVGVHVCVEGLDRAEVTLDDEGLELVLGYGPDELRIRDEGRAPGSLETFERLKTVAAADWLALWPRIEDRSRQWARESGLDDAAVDRELAAAEEAFAAAPAAFAADAESLHALYRASLRATSRRPATDLAGVYRDHALRRIRRHLAAAVSGPGGAPLRPIASGPCEGVVRGDPEAGSGAVVLSGADDVIVHVDVARAGGSLTETAVARTLHTFRPYAPGPEDVPLVGSGTGSASRALVALSHFHLQPDAETAARFVRAYASAQPAPAAADVTRLIAAMAAHHGLADDVTQALLRAAEEAR